MKQIVVLIIGIFFLSTTSVLGVEEMEKFKAFITERVEVDCQGEKCVDFTMQIAEGEREGELVTSSISPFGGLSADSLNLQKGDLVYIQEIGDGPNTQTIILGHVRELPLLLLFIIFVIAAVVVGKFNGAGALLGLGASMFTLFGIVSPLILNGFNPIIAAYLGAAIVLLTSIFFSHGINRKSIIALVSSLSGLVVISILALFFIEMIKLTGLGADNALEIISQSKNALDMKGILYASIIIGGVGVLDDITVNQVSVIEQIYLTNTKQTAVELYSKSMKIGRDHIASLINTLFIAYASASLPLVMLLQSTNSSFLDIINSDQFAEEIARAVIASLGLILVVPLSSFIAAYYVTKSKHKPVKDLKETQGFEVHSH